MGEPLTTYHLNRFFQEKVTLSRDEMRLCVNVVMENVVDSILKRVHEIDPRFERAAFHGGSYWQGLKVRRPDEFDLGINLSGLNQQYHWGGTRPTKFYGLSSPPQAPRPEVPINSLSGEVRVVRTSSPAPEPQQGYTFFDPGESRDFSSSIETENLEFDGDLVPFLVKRRLKLVLCQAVRDLGFASTVTVKKKASGPAVCLYIDHPPVRYPVSLDLAPTAPLIIPLPSSVTWPHPQARWPTTDKAKEVKEIGITFVAKKNLHWQISYSRMEKKLVEGIDQDSGCRKKLHRILKYINEKFWQHDNKPLISSYIIKNAWFWQCEKYWSHRDWQPDMLCERFYTLVEYIQSSLRAGRLPQYFNPNINLLASMDSTNRQILLRKIEDFLASPVQYLQR